MKKFLFIRKKDLLHLCIAANSAIQSQQRSRVLKNFFTIKINKRGRGDLQGKACGCPSKSQEDRFQGNTVILFCAFSHVQMYGQYNPFH
jgi:hypothetical protein